MDNNHQNNEFFQKFQKLLQEDLTKGWKKLVNSDRYKDYEAFALFLDGLDEFQNRHRKKIPHPPHEFSAREMGIPFMNRINSLGLFMDHWFPGDFYTNSKEIEEDVDGEEIHARIFHLTILHNKAVDKLCKLAIKFQHSHEGFSFFEPKLTVIEVYEKNPSHYVKL